ncbi:glycosyltransferase family 2 protein [Jatrophihabitans sp.]|uniref:glycosyltransferase family 2 protein n=1 Tax=Jatrophihabitans sp. TaxID=1932789 RepID=UPI0030C66766|nr:glycosyl transferase family 2 [Jatrophihabitans sp.]
MGGPGESDELPAVSVIMTALNESRHLAGAVESVLAQDYAGPLELVVAVGPSHDDTVEIAAQLAAANPRMSVVENPTGRTPAGLNIAIAATDPTTTVVVRTDGHAELPSGYVRTAVATLLRSGADNVGGMMIPEGTTPLESAVARAMSEKIGLGGSTFHIGGDEGPADTVYLGVFRRSILEKTGGFDEHYTRAQDWELNLRIRTLGGVVWFDPSLRVDYRPRGHLRDLAKQFRGSGEWRWQIIRAYPRTASVRYLAAPAATLAIGLALVAVVIGLAIGSPLLALIAAAVPLGYLAVILAAATVTRRGLGPAASAWYPLVLVTMHLSWGSGFLLGPLRSALHRESQGSRQPAPATSGKS